ncbi:MAG: regulatory protein RecX [Saprospiraceae bacterium]
MQKKYLSKEEALKKIQKYCVYQDRCHSEVRSRLLDMGVFGDTLEEIMVLLIEDRFLDEERFARSYARGKFNMKQWGRQRITTELKRRRISDYCIKKALEEIDTEKYVSTIAQLAHQKFHHYRTRYDAYPAQQKTANWLVQRGYEPELVWEHVRSLQNE